MTSIGSRLASVAGAIAIMFLVAGPAQAVPTVTIQPAYICNDDGTGCAAPVYDASVVQDFWLNEAGLTLNILSPREFHSTEHRTFSAFSDIHTFMLAQPHPDPNGPGNSYFSSPITFWFSDIDDPSLPGLLVFQHFVEGNRNWVNTVSPANLIEIAIAQALGFNLGLSASSESGNLMGGLFMADRLQDRHLTPEQVATILASQFVQDVSPPEVPLPAALPLFAGGLGVIALLAQRRKRRAGMAGAA